MDRIRLIPLLTALGGSFSFAQTVGPQSLDGAWRSEGYGYVFEIQGPTLRAFEITTRTCVAGFAGKRDGTRAVPGREATFKTKEGEVFFVRAGATGDHKLLHSEGSASDIRIDRLPETPGSCKQLTADTPLGNFEVFTRSWAEHYISFDLKRADWNKVVAENRATITPQTTPVQLFEIFEAMIKPFGDAHAAIYAPKLKRKFEGSRPGTDRAVKGGFDHFEKRGMPPLLAVTDRGFLKGTLRKFCRDMIQYGHLEGGIGYLRILAFGGYVRHGSFTANLTALELALDAIFSDPTLKALVIDVRLNGGGDDPLGLAVASRLATSDYLAYTKQARADPVDRDQWTPGDPSFVRPSSRPGFRGPVVELTGPLSMSAAETFTEALMGRTPHVTRIGENTQGVFSDVLERHLPNGWIFGLPNEVFRTAEGTVFDGGGIPPDIMTPVFADADIAAGKDPALEKALRLLAHRSL